MKKTIVPIAIAAFMALAFGMPAHAVSYDTAASAKQAQGEQVAKKGKKPGKSKAPKA